MEKIKLLGKIYKTFILLLSACSLAGCVNEVDEANKNLSLDGRVPISLSPYAKGTTRGETNTSEITDMSNGFVVVVITEKEGVPDTIVNNVPVLYNGETKSFEFWGGETYFWPEDEMQPVYIYAYGTQSHRDEESGVEHQYPALINEWNPDWIADYELPEDLLQNHLFGVFLKEFSHDMVYFADTVTRKENGNTINMAFRHATSKLNFQFKGDDLAYQYVITNLTVHSYYDGLFDLMAQAPRPNFYLGLQPNEILVEKDTINMGQKDFKPFYTGADNPTYAIVFPDKAKLEIAYKVIREGEVVNQLSGTVDLKVRQGNSYTCNITLSSVSSEIGVNVQEVDDWTEVDGELTPYMH